MKEIAAVLLVLFALSTSGFSRDEYAITKISPSFIPTPVTGGDKQRRGNAEFQWLAVEVDFRTTVENTDELTFNYYIALTGKCLAGEATYINVEKSRDSHVVMYVSPRALKHFAQGKRMSPNALENVTVQILCKGQPVAEKSLRPAPLNWWKNVEGVKGMVLKKDETPFKWSDWDYYEELKPEASH